MSEQPSTDPMGQFLGDLSAIREKRNVTLEALRDATKVYPNVISQFEEDGLKDHPLFNSLYVRAFIRSYAQAVSVPVDAVLNAYDEALKGSYKRQLAVEYLDLPAAEMKALQKEIAKTDAVFSAEKFEFNNEEKVPKPAQNNTSPKSTSSTTKKPAADKKSGKPQNRSQGRSQSRSQSRPPKSKQSKRRFSGTAKTIKEATESGAAISFVPKSKNEAEGFEAFVEDAKSHTRSFLQHGMRNAFVQWGLVILGLGLGVFVIIQLIQLQGNSNETTLSSAPEQAIEEPSSTGQDGGAAQETALNSIEADVKPIEPAPLQNLQNLTPVVLGDSIPFYIVAAGGKLDPFRLQKDRDLRRPYWLDEGDSMLVYLTDRAIVEDNLQNMQILFEGRPYPLYRTDSLARIFITRDSVDAFLNR